VILVISGQGKKNLESKEDELASQIPESKFDDVPGSGQLIATQPTLKKLVALASSILHEEKELKQQRDELIFAYQTLEIGYQRYWEFFHFAPDGYLVTDVNGLILEANQTILQMLSLPASALIGQAITSVIPDLNFHRSGLQMNWFSGSKQIDVSFNTKSKTTFYAAISIAHQLNSQNELIGLLWLIRDITERKNAEKALKSSERMNSDLLEKSPVPMCVVNADTSIGYINPALEKLTGFSAQMLSGAKPPYPWQVHSSPETILKLPGKRERGKTQRQEQLFRKKNGDKFWVEITSKLIKNGGQPRFHLQTWVDITESRRLRENLEYYVMQISKIQEEERQRVSQELHEDVLQSLAALSLHAELIIESSYKNSAEIIDEIKELKTKLNDIIEDVRRFSYELRPGELDYLGLPAALETLTVELSKRGTHANLIVTGTEVNISPEKKIAIFRIAQEACSNIRKYSRAKMATIHLQYTRTKIKLFISDDGKGFQIPDSLSDLAHQGKLGLIGIEERARLSGGTFFIKSHPTKGTMITVALPISGGLHSQGK
jgi:PAS domain S-box-containing protein